MREIHHASFKTLYTQFQDQQSRQHALTLCRLIRLSSVDVAGAIRDHVLGDDWFDFALGSLRSHFKLTAGHVYLAASLDQEGLIKLGKTGQSPDERIRALSRENVVHPFVLLHAERVHDRHWIELQCHHRLTEQGVPRIKEFFPAQKELLRECIEFVTARDRTLFEKQGLASALPRDASLAIP